ncbi:MAG: ribonuclease H-like domain-containing protein [Thermodesulfobacteriota bacterium]
MLPHTFIHLPGIGAKTEQNLWQAGINSWDEWCSPPSVRLPHSSVSEIESLLKKSGSALDSSANFFTDRLPAAEHWRIFPHFRQKTAYLDIETDGLGEYARITTIALYDGNQILHYINGHNLDQFPTDIMAYDVLVTYNGKTFDIPVIERFFRVRLDQAQIDLRYVLARLGFKGGLKACEKQLGLSRGSLDGVDGFFAVLLWREYEQKRDRKALETLIAYNIEDTVNLERLLVEAYNRNVDQTPFGDQLHIPLPEPPELPFAPDLDTVERLRQYRLAFD